MWIRSWVHGVFGAALILSGVAVVGAEIPPRARQHALAWRANIENLRVLSCEYSVFTIRAPSLEAAGKRAADATGGSILEKGRFYVSGDRRLVIARRENTWDAWLQKGKVRIYCYGPTNRRYEAGDVATSAGGIHWAVRFESMYTPHRMLSMGNSLWSRVDYAILGDSPAVPARTVRVTIRRNVQWLGWKVDDVAVLVRNPRATNQPAWVYHWYFDASRLGLLVGRASGPEGSEPKSASVLVDYESLAAGHWYPTLVVAGAISASRGHGTYRVVRVTRLEQHAPPDDVFALALRGQFRLPELGSDAVAHLRDETLVRADDLEEFAAGLAAEVARRSKTIAAARPLIPGVKPKRLRSAPGQGLHVSALVAVGVGTAIGAVILAWYGLIRRRRIRDE